MNMRPQPGERGTLAQKVTTVRKRPLGELFRDVQAHCVCILLRALRSLQEKVLISMCALCTAIFFPLKLLHRRAVKKSRTGPKEHRGCPFCPVMEELQPPTRPCAFNLFTCTDRMIHCRTESVHGRDSLLFSRREFGEIPPGLAQVWGGVIKMLFLDRKTGWVRAGRLLGWGGQHRVKEITYRLFSIWSRLTWR